VLSQALLSLHTVIQQSGAAVTSDPLPTAVANEAMLMHLFQNLIGNSIKYKGEAAPAIHISALRTAEGWLFSVRDNGVGIDPADAEFVFGNVQAPPRQGNSRHGHWACTLQEGSGTPWRTHLGGIGSGAWCHL
jgi:light-regulated signal transduction histidine kinase (bacteriophytochrome)